MTARLIKFPDYVGTPVRKHPDDAGLDLYSASDVTISSGGFAKVSTGIGIVIPQGFVGFLSPRSSFNAKGILEFTGIVDAGYEGEISGVLYNTTSSDFVLHRGDRFAQLVITPMVDFSLSEETDGEARGSKGFGSTGNK